MEVNSSTGTTTSSPARSATATTPAPTEAAGMYAMFVDSVPISVAKSVRQRSDGRSQSSIQLPCPDCQAASARSITSTVVRGGSP